MAADSLRKASTKSKSQISFSFALLSNSVDNSPERFCFPLTAKVFVDVK